jgi:PAS domain S-box-containing protein
MLSYFKRRREGRQDAPNVAPKDVPTEYEFKLLQKNGTVRIMLINVSMIPDTKKSLVSLMDITDRAKAESDLRESEKRFKDIAMLLPAVICEWDSSFRLRYTNAMGFQMFQLTKEQFDRGINLFDMISPQDRTKAEKDLHNVFLGDFGNAREYCVKKMDGTPLHILVNSAPIMPERGLRMCILDITDRVQAEQKLREMEKQAEEARIKLAQQETEKAKHEIANLRKEILERAAFADMVSRSPLMKEIFDILPEVAATPATVLVTGESGTGKELVARSLHELSSRKSRPFIAINCSALPDTLLESELFGYKAGAFTDAKKDKPGTFSRAHGGTIFLDEIGDISPAMQVKLLRVIQEKTFEPLGATEPVTVDVRIIAATNKDLAEQIKKGLFREDLFYRINVLVIKLPPLRDRRCDIPVLCDHFIGRFNSRYNKEIKGVSPEAESMLLAHDFPGNIRELENIIERAFVFCKDPLIGVAHLPQQLRTPYAGATVQSLSHVKDFDELEKLYLQSVLSETNGSRIKAAERLGIHKATLFRKLRKLGIEKNPAAEE